MRRGWDGAGYPATWSAVSLPQHDGVCHLSQRDEHVAVLISLDLLQKGKALGCFEGSLLCTQSVPTSRHQVTGRKQHPRARFPVTRPTAWSAQACPPPAAPSPTPASSPHPDPGRAPPPHTPPAALSSQHLEDLESTAAGSTSSRQRKAARRSMDTRACGNRSPRSPTPEERFGLRALGASME